MRRSRNILRYVDLFAMANGQAKIGDVRAIVRVAQNVLRLDVAVDESLLVRVRERFGGLGNKLGGGQRR